MSISEKISEHWLFRKIFYFFPVQLIFVHLKNNPILTCFWLIIIAITTRTISEKYGIPFLFLTPEYLGHVSFWSYLIVGFSFGGFIMAFNIASYITNGHRFPFIATLSKPFVKYSVNNIFWSGTIVITYIYSSFKFLVFEEGYSIFQTIIFQLSFLLGVALMFWLNYLYFVRTNKDLEKLSGGKYKTEKRNGKAPIKAVLHKKVKWENFFNPDREWRVETYLAHPFQVGIARSTEHYDKEMLKQVFEQNHLNAALFELIVLVSLVSLSFGGHLEVLTIPAGASVTLLFTMLIMLSSAIHSWFRGWAPAVIILLVLVFNQVSKYEFFNPQNKAYGLNYSTKPVDFNTDVLNHNINPENYQKDYLHTVRILENWKKKNTGPNGKKPKMIFINTTGGGMRSAVWSFFAMQQCDSILNGKLLNQTQMISGSSGGLVGMSYLRELMLREQNGEIEDIHNRKHTNDLAKDILNKVAFSLTVNDLFFKFQSFEDSGERYQVDRGSAFEDQLNANTNGYLDRRLFEYYKPELESKIPMLIVNPTIINNGKRLIISPQPTSYLSCIAPQNSISSNYLLESIEFKRLFKYHGANNLKFTSALRMSSTFPYVMPIVHLPSKPQLKVMDAGLRDNFGMKNTIKFLYTFRNWIKNNTSGVIFIQIRDTPKQHDVEEIEEKSILASLSAPVGTVYKNLFLTQDYDHDQLLQYTSEWFKGNVDVIDFTLDNTKEQKLSLSWHLTEKEKKITYNSINLPQNQYAIKKLIHLIENE